MPKLPELVLSLPAPLGLQGTKQGTSTAKALSFCLSLGLTQVHGEVEVKKVLDALISANYRKRASPEDIQIEKASPGEEAPPGQRFEVSRILAEEMLTDFIRVKKGQKTTDAYTA